jgi:hypothetical protein
MSYQGLLFLGAVGTSSLMLTITSAPSFWHPSNHLHDSANLHSSNALQDSSNLVYGHVELGDPLMSEHYPGKLVVSHSGYPACHAGRITDANFYFFIFLDSPHVFIL